MVKIIRLASCLLAISIFSEQPLRAQLALSTVRGTATDPAGAIVSHAEITLIHLETNARRMVVTNENGDYEIPDLPRGTYRLTVSAAGFKNFIADNIILESNQTRRINVPLELGTVGTEITIRADAAVIATDTAKIQSAISGTKYADVPWVGAEATLDPSLILTTVPLVSQTSGVWSSQWAGQSSAQVQEGQDGHTNDGAVNQLNDILDVQEVTVVTVNNSAEFARVGYMNMVTKSGSNHRASRAPTRPTPTPSAGAPIASATGTCCRTGARSIIGSTPRASSFPRPAASEIPAATFWRGRATTCIMSRWRRPFL